MKKAGIYLDGHGTYYDKKTDASIFNSFSTSVFRFGHSMVQGVVDTYLPDRFTRLFFNQFLQRDNYLTDTQVNYILIVVAAIRSKFYLYLYEL